MEIVQPHKIADKIIINNMIFFTAAPPSLYPSAGIIQNLPLVWLCEPLPELELFSRRVFVMEL